jgi:hypothetical protein
MIGGIGQSGFSWICFAGLDPDLIYSRLLDSLDTNFAHETSQKAGAGAGAGQENGQSRTRRNFASAKFGGRGRN